MHGSFSVQESSALNVPLSKIVTRILDDLLDDIIMGKSQILLASGISYDIISQMLRSVSQSFPSLELHVERRCVGGVAG